MSTDDKRAREQEFDMLMARAGAVVPADRRAGLIACCDELRRMAALVRQPRTAAAEPSNVFSLKPFTRKS